MPATDWKEQAAQRECERCGASPAFPQLHSDDDGNIVKKEQVCMSCLKEQIDDLAAEAEDEDACPYGRCTEHKACADCKYDHDLQYREDEWRR